MAGLVDRVEVVHGGYGPDRRSRRRLWFDNELIGVESISGVGAVAGFGSDVEVVETVFEDSRAEVAYWDAGSGAVLPACRVRHGGVWTRFTAGGSMLDIYAPVDGLCGATLFARLECSGLALDPRAVFEVDLRLVEGRPVEAEGGGLPVSPEVMVSGSVDEMFAWCSGIGSFPELPSLSLSGGDVFLLGVLSGVLCMSGGFRVPPEMVVAADILVDLVQDHRAALDEHEVPL